MRILILGLLTVSMNVAGQTVEETYPKTLFCENDLFMIKYGNYPSLDTFNVSRTDKTSPGMDAWLNAYAVIYYNNDSLRLNYNNKIPYQHNFYINFESPKGKTTLRFHFNGLANYFDNHYIETYGGKVSFAIPEVYELANIIWTISPTGKRAKDLYTESEYYQKVVNYFSPYLDHPIFKQLDLPDSLYSMSYYTFRENSFAFNFQNAGAANTKLLFNGPYYYVYGDEYADSSFFGKLKPLVEDFAKRSKFRKFYKDNQAYYQQQILREKELLPVKQMWDWLEGEFPLIKYQSYKIIFSPLIGGSHSTQNFSTYTDTGIFSESVMFIRNTDRVDKMTNLTEKQKQALMSGIVFTEIDHNYVNRSTSKYRKQVDSIFSNRTIWAKKGNADWYGRPVDVFNEYMTWSVFCLYIVDNYDKETADLVIDERENIMVNRRDFIKFKEFNQALIKIRQSHTGLEVVELYPFIIEWCRQQR